MFGTHAQRRLPVTLCVCQKVAASTTTSAPSTAHLLRRRFFFTSPTAVSPVSRLNGSIESYLRSGSKRSFSHLMRRNGRLRRPSLSSTASQQRSRSATQASSHVSSGAQLQLAHLIAPASIRSYSSSYRNHHVQLYGRIASALKLDFLHPAIADDARLASSNSKGSLPRDRHVGPIAGRARSIMAARGFSHRLRERQAALLRAFLPLVPYRAASTAVAAAAAAATTANATASHGATGGTRSGKLSLLLRIALAGGTIYAALQFLTTQQSGAQSTVLNAATYVPFSVTAVERISPTTSILTLTGSFSKDDLEHPIAGVSVKEPGSNIQRPYTVLESSPDDNNDGGGIVKILVRRYEDGVLSRYITDRRPGGRLFLRLAPSAWSLPSQFAQPGAEGRIVMIVGGTGVATAYQLVRYFARRRNTSLVQVDVLYSSRSRDEIYLSDDLDRLAHSVRYFVDDEKTYVDADAIRAVATGDSQVLVCGSDGFVDYVAGYKPESGQGDVGGLCGRLGLTNVYKL